MKSLRSAVQHHLYYGPVDYPTAKQIKIILLKNVCLPPISIVVHQY